MRPKLQVAIGNINSVITMHLLLACSIYMLEMRSPIRDA